MTQMMSRTLAVDRTMPSGGTRAGGAWSAASRWWRRPSRRRLAIRGAGGLVGERARQGQQILRRLGTDAQDEIREKEATILEIMARLNLQDDAIAPR